MNYRLTCLTPVLIGDGQKLSPVDYMVWKDQVSVLDQRRIFRLLAKGPRLENYLAQIKRAERLEFASWGGFAQSYAGRRIPFESAACARYWEQARGDSLHIPTFASGPSGPYLPASALKGALHTAMLAASMDRSVLDAVAAQFDADRPPRRPADVAEERTMGLPGASRMRWFRLSDSKPISPSCLKIYLLRVATVVLRGGKPELGWKISPRGAAEGNRPEEATPWFAEMAVPGTVFEGRWREDEFLRSPEVARALRWDQPPNRAAILGAANGLAARLLALHRTYAESLGLDGVAASLRELEQKLAACRNRDDACLLTLGWGAGLLAKIAWTDTSDETYRRILRRSSGYASAPSSALPFPKTRRIVFVNDRPAALPGWALLELS
ncbi:MAG: type III-A CRISPR-associated RAMP protein Csm5 [Bryobacterales bacterium]|nr:type III-A CRISPR-associated RAMP protein Csm5 [Bryobacteraceae bacterium]MDW8355622.1 type III-A CRISPR-associated RAMP protein Csm5 [Bryobacterales bacterium]